MNTKVEKITDEMKIIIDHNFNRVIEDIKLTHHGRTSVYNYNHYTFGNVMEALFPDGVNIKTPEDWNKYSLLITMVAKLSRYATCLSRTGKDHVDSIHDNAIYSILMEEMLVFYNKQKENNADHPPIKPTKNPIPQNHRKRQTNNVVNVDDDELED